MRRPYSPWLFDAICSRGARINAVWANAFFERGKKPLDEGNEEAAKAAFAEALRFDVSSGLRNPCRAGRMRRSAIGRGEKQAEQGNDDAAKSMFAEAIKRVRSATRRIEEAWANGFVKRGVTRAYRYGQ